MKIPMKLAHKYIRISFNFSTTSNILHSLQVKNCNSKSRLVVDEDKNGKIRCGMVIGEQLLSYLGTGQRAGFLSWKQISRNGSRAVVLFVQGDRPSPGIQNLTHKNT